MRKSFKKILRFRRRRHSKQNINDVPASPAYDIRSVKSLTWDDDERRDDDSTEGIMDTTALLREQPLNDSPFDSYNYSAIVEKVDTLEETNKVDSVIVQKSVKNVTFADCTVFEYSDSETESIRDGPEDTSRYHTPSFTKGDDSFAEAFSVHFEARNSRRVPVNARTVGQNFSVAATTTEDRFESLQSGNIDDESLDYSLDASSFLDDVIFDDHEDTYLEATEVNDEIYFYKKDDVVEESFVVDDKKGSVDDASDALVDVAFVEEAAADTNNGSMGDDMKDSGAEFEANARADKDSTEYLLVNKAVVKPSGSTCRLALLDCLFSHLSMQSLLVITMIFMIAPSCPPVFAIKSIGLDILHLFFSFIVFEFGSIILRVRFRFQMNTLWKASTNTDRKENE